MPSPPSCRRARIRPDSGANSAAVPLVDLVVDETVAPFERWLVFPDGKFAALHAAAPLVAGLPSGQVARQVARVACRLGLSFAEVTDAVTGALRAQE